MSLLPWLLFRWHSHFMGRWAGGRFIIWMASIINLSDCYVECLPKHMLLNWGTCAECTISWRHVTELEFYFLAQQKFAMYMWEVFPLANSRITAARERKIICGSGQRLPFPCCTAAQRSLSWWCPLVLFSMYESIITWLWEKDILVLHAPSVIGD